MTNPTEQFRAAVESALDNYLRGAGFTHFHRKDRAEALASIQASTVKMLLELVGEDEPEVWEEMGALKGLKQGLYFATPYAKS